MVELGRGREGRLRLFPPPHKLPSRMGVPKIAPNCRRMGQRHGPNNLSARGFWLRHLWLAGWDSDDLFMPNSNLETETNGPPDDGGHGRLIKLGRVTCAFGYSLANCAAIEVDGGYVLVDALASVAAAKRVQREFDQHAIGPLLAVIYTHSHSDHIRGTTAFLESQVPIWAQENFIHELHRTYMLSRGSFRRGAKQFGYGLPAGAVPTGGIGPPLRLDEGVAPPLKVPTHTFRHVEELVIGDVRI